MKFLMKFFRKFFRKSNKNVSTQQSIPYEEYYKNGLFRLDEQTWTFVCELAEIGYLSKTESEQKRKYNTYLDMLNSIPPNIHYQEFIYNLPVDTGQYLSAIASKSENYSSDYEKTFFDIQRKFIAETGRETSRKKYIIAFSFRNTAGENPYNILYDTMIMLSDKFREVGSNVRLLMPNEVFAELFHIYHPFDGTMPELPIDLFRRGLSVRDIVCPDAMEFNHKYIRMGDAYCRVLSITSYGSEIVDSLIYTLLSLNSMLYVSKHLEHESKEEALKNVNKQLQELEGRRQKILKNHKQDGTDYISYELQSSVDGCKEVKAKLYGSEEFFRMTVYVMITAKSPEELTQLEEIIRSRALSAHCTLKAISLEQDKALNSVLPFAKDYLKRHQFMLSSEAAVATPFSFESYFDQGGFLYGFNDRSGVPAILNRKLDKSSNGFVFGVTGSGKGIFAKNEITNVLYQPSCKNDDVVIVDPTGEYLPLADKFGGEIVSLSSASGTRINPLHISPEQLKIKGRDAAISAQMDFMVAFLSQIKDTEPLTAAEKSVADTAFTTVFKKKKNPTLTDFYDELEKYDRPEAAAMRSWLERYVHGSTTLFSGQSNISDDSRFVVYDLRDLTGDLKNLGMLAMLSRIKNRVMENYAKGKWTWIYIDEFHRFFDETRNPYAAEIFAQLFSELRHYGGIITGITQLPLPVIESQAGSVMLANSSFVVSSELDSRNLAKFAELYQLNEDQKRLLESPQIGQYILRTKGVPVQLKLLFPGKKPEEKNLLYDLFNTDFKDRAAALQGLAV